MEESGVGARGSYSAWLGFQDRLDVCAVDVTAETRGSGSCGACTDAEAGAGARGARALASRRRRRLGLGPVARLLGLGRRGATWAARLGRGEGARELGRVYAGPSKSGKGAGPRGWVASWATVPPW